MGFSINSASPLPAQRIARGTCESAGVAISAAWKSCIGACSRHPYQAAQLYLDATSLARSALGRRDAARPMAEEELADARRFGVPDAEGASLRTLGLVIGGVDGIELLRQSVAALERWPQAPSVATWAIGRSAPAVSLIRPTADTWPLP